MLHSRYLVKLRRHALNPQHPAKLCGRSQSSTSRSPRTLDDTRDPHSLVLLVSLPRRTAHKTSKRLSRSVAFCRALSISISLSLSLFLSLPFPRVEPCDDDLLLKPGTLVVPGAVPLHVAGFAPRPVRHSTWEQDAEDSVEPHLLSSGRPSVLNADRPFL